MCIYKQSRWVSLVDPCRVIYLVLISTTINTLDGTHFQLAGCVIAAMTDNTTTINDWLNLAPVIDAVGRQAFYNPFSWLNFSVAFFKLMGTYRCTTTDQQSDQ